MAGESESLKYICYKIKLVAPTDASVLIQGETGTGGNIPTADGQCLRGENYMYYWYT